jgi:hypothetical protein
MKKTILIFTIILGLTTFFPLFAQQLKPYFNKTEYKELLLISLRTNTNQKYYSQYPEPQNYKMIYQSKETGLDNLWQLWINTVKPIAVISIRGTTANPESTLANLYAAMIPANGKIRLSKTDTFSYVLSENPKAAVHIGWLISMAYLSRDILPKIDSLYKTGIKDFLLTGHSQGGAINYLLTAYLYHLQQQGTIPKDIRFKTYCSAAPKPGNLYFAYSYEKDTRNGWGYNVVNAADWVPEMPISIQTLNDINRPNPIISAQKNIKNLKFPKNILAKHIYNKLNKPTRKAQQNYEKYLGEMTSKFIRKKLVNFIPPDEYVHSSNYVRTGITIVLYPQKDYYDFFANDKGSFFLNHGLKYYLYLIDKQDF